MSNHRKPRTFSISQAVRGDQRAFISISGASGSGKTKSALELGTGLVAVTGGKLYGIDTENGRMKKYAPAAGETVRPGVTYDFHHVPLDPPFDPDSYLDALRFCETDAGAASGCVIIDSQSHEHAGPGGRLDSQAKEAERLAERSRHNKDPEAHKFSAFRPNSAARGNLLWQGFLRTRLHVILCFRAKESFEQRGKTIVDIGYAAIGADEFVFEADCSILLMPGAKGVPTWASERDGEKRAIKLPQEYAGILNDGRALSANHGQRIAQWLNAGGAIARGATSSRPTSVGGEATPTGSPSTSGAGVDPPAPLTSSDAFPGDMIEYAGARYDPALPCPLTAPLSIANMETHECKAWATKLAELMKAAPDYARRAWFDRNTSEILALKARGPALAARLEELANSAGNAPSTADGGASEDGEAWGSDAPLNQSGAG